MRYVPVIALFLITVFFLSGLYRPWVGFSRINEFVVLFKSVAVTTVFVILWLYLTSSPHSKLVVLLTSFHTFLFVNICRWLGRSIYRDLSKRKEDDERTRILIVGTQEIARLICRKLLLTASVNSRIAGFIDEHAANVGARIDGYEVLGGLGDLGRIIEAQRIQEVFLAMPMMPHAEVMDLINRHSQRGGVHFYVVSNLFDLISAEVDIAEHSSIPLTHLRNENMDLLPLLLKRAFDVAISTAVIVLTLPFWILIMVAIRLETEGPAIFRQARVGKSGKVFQINKFRTMYSDTPKFALSPSAPSDSRVTKVGKFLRKTSLDEFPQFFNVLRGEMSLVGPRPEMPFIVERYSDWERQRLKVKPGITGLWQIMGRKDLPLHESLEYDFYYIKNQSLLLDLTIVLKTIPVVLAGKGAY
jgi:exopolysaccharide biosynthesis polyprenyl glycosylphosphotransferase